LSHAIASIEVIGRFEENWCRDTEQELIREPTRRGARFGKISDMKVVKFDGHTELRLQRVLKSKALNRFFAGSVILNGLIKDGKHLVRRL
jgi:hypothetical protein